MVVGGVDTTPRITSRFNGLREQLDLMATWPCVEKVRSGPYVRKGGGGSSIPLWQLRKSEHQGRKLTFKVLGNNGQQCVVVIGSEQAVLERLRKYFAVTD